MYASGGEKVHRLKNRSGGYKDTLLPLLKPLRESRYRRWGIIICSSYTKKVNNLNPAMKIAHCCSQARMRRNPKTIEMFEVASSKGSSALYFSSVCVFLWFLPLCYYTMSAQLSANASHCNNGSPVVVNKGKFTFCVDRNETRFTTLALASSVQNQFENYCLGDVSIDHIGKEWYKVEFFYEEDIRNFIQVERLENEPAVFPTDMVNDEALQQQLSKEVILVFPQSTIVSSHMKAEFIGERDVDNY
ncbi:hypothetical protein ACE6H2_010352 [Prunus campanulata]